MIFEQLRDVHVRVSADDQLGRAQSQQLVNERLRSQRRDEEVATVAEGNRGMSEEGQQRNE